VQRLKDVFNEGCIRFWLALTVKAFNLSLVFKRRARAFNNKANQAIANRSPAQIAKMQQADDARLAAILRQER